MDAIFLVETLWISHLVYTMTHRNLKVSFCGDIAAVFDGHGGHCAAEYLSNNLYSVFSEEIDLNAYGDEQPVDGTTLLISQSSSFLTMRRYLEAEWPSHVYGCAGSAGDLLFTCPDRWAL